MKNRLSIGYLLVSTALISLLLSTGFAAGEINDFGNATSGTTALCLNLAIAHSFLILAQLLGFKMLVRWIFVAALSSVSYMAYSTFAPHFISATSTHLPVNIGVAIGAFVTYSICFLIAEVVSIVIISFCPSRVDAVG